MEFNVTDNPLLMEFNVSDNPLLMGFNTTESQQLTTSNASLQRETGYDLPVIGLKTGQLNLVHVPAIACISVSMCCAISVILVSFYYNKNKSFFKDHVSPKWVCYLYSVITVEFALAQVLLINVIAVNAFILMYKEFQIKFGKRDYRLILHTAGLPALFLIVCGAVGHLGPNGQICAMDGVRSDASGVVITTLFTSVLVANIILYFLTWIKIRKEAKQVNMSVSGSTSEKAVQKAAKTMMMFVVAFFIQWWAYSIYGIWRLAAPATPILLAKLVGIFSNLGGIMNAIVYVIIRWGKFKEAKGGAKLNKLLLSSSSGDGIIGGVQQAPLLDHSKASQATFNTDSSNLDSGISEGAV